MVMQDLLTKRKMGGGCESNGIYYFDIAPSPVAWSAAAMAELEHDIATFYTQSFFDSFKRAPIIPCRLSHTVEPYVPPMSTSKYHVVGPRANVFYDLTALDVDE